MVRNQGLVILGCWIGLAGLTIVACAPAPETKQTQIPATGAASTKDNTSAHEAHTKAPAADPTSVEEHGHEAGAHGGIIVSLGRDSYHVEAVVTGDGELLLYTLGNDETRVIDIELQELTAHVKTAEGTASSSVPVIARPQKGDAEGKASLFAAKLPDSMLAQALTVTIPNITISGERFRLGFSTEHAAHDSSEMPAKVEDDEERALYLAPGGIYTQADIEANGNTTASQKFRGFKAAHDLHPQPGDKICPVTLTKANPDCSWIIGGKKYEFCCPPCVDEFVTLAKTEPDKIKAPEDYVQK